MRINCEHCGEPIELGLLFWEYKAKCKSCGYTMDFKEHKRLSVILPFFNLMAVLTLLAVAIFTRPVIQERLSTSYLTSLLIVLILVVLLTITVLLPLYRTIICCIYDKSAGKE